MAWVHRMVEQGRRRSGWEAQREAPSPCPCPCLCLRSCPPGGGRAWGPSWPERRASGRAERACLPCPCQLEQASPPLACPPFPSRQGRVSPPLASLLCLCQPEPVSPPWAYPPCPCQREQRACPLDDGRARGLSWPGPRASEQEASEREGRRAYPPCLFQPELAFPPWACLPFPCQREQASPPWVSLLCPCRRERASLPWASLLCPSQQERGARRGAQRCSRQTIKMGLSAQVGNLGGW